MSEPRPKQLTEEMKLAAARDIAEQLFREGHVEADQVEQCVGDIAKHARRHMDGYQLAKTLDDRAYWDCDLSMVETLDGFSSAADRLISQAEKAWFERVKVEPSFPNGARVCWAEGFGKKTGTIEGIYDHGPAKYLIVVDGEPGKGRRIVNFEDVSAIDAAEASAS